MTIAQSTLNPILFKLLQAGPAEPSQLNCLACEKQLKCCDFQPFVANFLLGAMISRGLKLPEPTTHFGYHPIGLVATKHFRELHEKTPEEDRGEDFLCTFFDKVSRQCTVWNERPGECSTYLCSPLTEQRRRLSQQSFEFEVALSQMALARQGFSKRELSGQVDAVNAVENSLDQAGPPSRHDVIETYQRAWSWVKDLKDFELEELKNELKGVNA